MNCSPVEMFLYQSCLFVATRVSIRCLDTSYKPRRVVVIRLATIKLYCADRTVSIAADDEHLEIATIKWQEKYILRNLSLILGKCKL